MTGIIIIAGIVMIIAGLVILYILRNKKPGKYIWVGPGEDPFKEKEE